MNVSNALDNRPLLVRLQKRIEKLGPEGHTGAKPVDVELHRQSVALVEELAAALLAARDLWGDYLSSGNSNAMKAMNLVDAAIAKTTQ